MDCVECGGALSGTQTKYCSRKCKHRAFSRKKRREGRHEYLARVCSQCEKKFKARRFEQRFCSRRCASDAKRRFLSIPGCLENASRKLDKTLGYVRVYCPMHPEANTWGYVYEHRLVAEQMIGRRLIKDEVVHHKNRKRWDNRPENLEVMDKRAHGRISGQRSKAAS